MSEEQQYPCKKTCWSVCQHVSDFSNMYIKLKRTCVNLMCMSISILHECEVKMEKSVTEGELFFAGTR
jgi:hypothetical protein